MAVIARMPSVAIVNGFKGVLDYYVYRGIPCVRKWPRYKPRTPTPYEALQQAVFADAVASARGILAWRQAPPYQGETCS